MKIALVDQPGTVLADINQFEIALLNLVINARDAMPKGGTVMIETRKATRGGQSVSPSLDAPGSDFVQVSVRDAGMGMSPDVIARASEAFFTTKDAGKGTGLGLYQVADFARQAGGHVTIQSEVGIGTCVSIHLPRLTGRMGSALAEQSDETSELAGRGETILVVENEPEILAYTEEGLDALGFRTLGAQDASSALTALEGNSRVALVFSDLGLPGVTGHQLAREVVRRWPTLPIVLTSGGPAQVSSWEGSEAREIAYIAKPYAVAKLAGMIRTILDAQLGVAAKRHS